MNWDRVLNAIGYGIAAAAGGVVNNPDIVSGHANWTTWVVIGATALLGALRGPGTASR